MKREGFAHVTLVAASCLHVPTALKYGHTSDAESATPALSL